jgi:hypothetical protein
MFFRKRHGDPRGKGVHSARRIPVHEVFHNIRRKEGQVCSAGENR